VSPDDARHGSERGNEQHVRDGEEPCTACYEAKLSASRRRGKRKAAGLKYTLPVGEPTHRRLLDLTRQGATYEDIAAWADVSASVVFYILKVGPGRRVYARTALRLREFTPGPIITPLGITRRIRSLMRLGYSSADIAAASGAHVDTINNLKLQPPTFVARKVRRGVVDAYDRLHMSPPKPVTSQQKRVVTRVRRYAESEGWPTGLAWDDIDHDEQPTGHQAEATKPRIGNADDYRAAAERTLEDITHMADSGATADEIARRLGYTTGSLKRNLERRGEYDLWRRIRPGDPNRDSHRNRHGLLAKKDAAA
jgi:hypothetical protein